MVQKIEKDKLKYQKEGFERAGVRVRANWRRNIFHIDIDVCTSMDV